MFSWLKKHFIPHEGNEHRPHILRGVSTRNIVAIIIFLEIFTFLIPVFAHLNISGNMAAVLPGVLSDLTNSERQSQNIPTLAISPLLNEAAQLKANDMATNGYFAHTSPSGKTPWYWLDLVGYNYQYAGENLAINFNDSMDVTNAWMASPTHKANIVKGNYTEIGTGVATGIYQGRQTIFVAQLYANPLPTSQTTVTTTATTTTKKTNATSAVATVKEPANVLGAQTEANITPTPVENVTPTPAATPVKNPTLFQKLLASPRNTTNIILYTIFGIIVIALLLYIIIKMKNHHKDLITNGLIVLAVIGAVFVTNYYLSHRNMVITDSMDYSNQGK